MIKEVVDKQLKAFNEKNLDKFAECYADAIEGYTLDTGEVLNTGKKQLLEAMKQGFESKPDSYTEVLNQIVQKELVVNHELIRNYVEGKIVRVVTLYEVKDGKITRVWFTNRTLTDD